MKIFAYDLEVYSNFFSAIFINIEDKNDIYKFTLNRERDDLESLKQFVNQPDLRLVGYNSIGYDDIIIKYLLTRKSTNRQLFNLSKQIIFKKPQDYSYQLKQLKWVDAPFESVDLMQLVSINTIRPSLKSCGIHLKYPLIQDLPLDPEKPVKKKDFELLLKYNVNDVLVTRALYLELLPDIELRELLGKQYNVSMLSASDSKIAKIVLDHAYGIPTIKETKRTSLYVKDLIPKKLQFDTQYLQNFLRKLERKKIVIGDKKTNINEKVSIGNIICTLAQGGIHSEDDPGVFVSDDDYVLIDSDVASYYPNIILNESAIPEHLDKNRFYNLYKDIIDRRLEAKDKKDKVTADTLKITVNSTFGLMGFPYYWLYDMKCMYQVTIGGQLYLLDLAEKLIQNDFELISMNTDGVLFKVKRNSITKYEQICKQWENRTKFVLEHNQYRKYVRRDVNNYMSVDYNDKIKTKGIFTDGLLSNAKAKKRILVTAYNAPIIALALQSYFKDDIKPEITINNETDIHNFFFSQKTDKKFKMYAQQIVSGKLKKVELQKTNRWIVSKKGGYYLEKKHQLGGRDTAHMKHVQIQIGNDVNDVSLEMVDRQYYIDSVWDIVNEIEQKHERVRLF